MKKHFTFLLLSFFFGTAVFAQAQEEKPATLKKIPHLTFGLQNDAFYYSKGTDTVKQKMAIVDSITIASIIDKAIIEYKVAPKNLNVVLQGDDLLLHPQFDLLIDTILSRTISEVRVKTNVFE